MKPTRRFQLPFITGKTSLAEFIEQLLKWREQLRARLRLLLTNDTGTMHLADGFGVPLVGDLQLDLTAPDRPALTQQHCLGHQM